MNNETDFKMIQGDFGADCRGLMYSKNETNENFSFAAGSLPILSDDNTRATSSKVTPVKINGTTFYQNIESANINIEFSSHSKSKTVERSSSAGDRFSHGIGRILSKREEKRAEGEDSPTLGAERMSKYKSGALAKNKADDFIDIDNIQNAQNDFSQIFNPKIKKLSKDLETMNMRELMLLNPNITSAKALLQVFEPMIENWKQVALLTDEQDKNNNTTEDVDKHVNLSIPSKQKNDDNSLSKNDIIKELTKNEYHKESSPIITEATDVKERVGVKDTLEDDPVVGINFNKGLAYQKSYNLATGLHMIEASSNVVNYIFTLSDRGDISRILSPLVSEVIIINTIRQRTQCYLEIGVMVESQEQFYSAIENANYSLKKKGFNFKPKKDARNALSYLRSSEVFPKVDSNGIYQITVKLKKLCQGNKEEMSKSEKELSKELERRVQNSIYGVVKISFGAGERILQLVHIKDMLRTYTIVNNLFEVNPSKHMWLNRALEEKTKMKERKEETRMERDMAEKERVKEWKKKAKLRGKERDMPINESEEEELLKVKIINNSSKPADITALVSEAMDHSLPQIQKGKCDALPLFSNQNEIMTMTMSDDEGESLEIAQPSTTTLVQDGGSYCKKHVSKKSQSPRDKIKSKGLVEEVLEEILEKALFISDEKAESKSDVGQLGQENEVIFRRINEKDTDMMKEDVSWFGSVISFLIVENNKNNSLLDVRATFETGEEMEAAYFGLCEKYKLMEMKRFEKMEC